MPSNNEPHIYLWQDGKWSDVATLTGFESATTTAINDQAMILCDGTLVDSGHTLRNKKSFIWREGQIIDVGASGSDYSRATAMNDLGEVVGVNDDFISQIQEGAFKWQNGQMVMLPKVTLPAVYAINNKGQIAGAQWNAPSMNEEVSYGILWQDGHTTDIGSLPGKRSATPYSINEKGEVVGSAFDSGDPDVYNADRSFLWRNGSMIDLGNLGGKTSEALAINNNSQVVGSSETSQLDSDYSHTPISHAYIWQNGHMIDLNTLIPKNSGLVLQSATGINDAGQIRLVAR